MSRRIRFGSTTDGTLDALDAQLDTGNENGNNPDNDLVARDSNGNIVLRYDESAGAWTLEGVNLNANTNDIQNVGGFDSDSVVTESASINGPLDAQSATVEKADTRNGYTDVLSSRSFDTVETNTSGSDMDVLVSVQVPGENTDVTVSTNFIVDGETVAELRDDSVDGTWRKSYSVTVADESTYEVTSSGDTGSFEISRWWEQT